MKAIILAAGVGRRLDNSDHHSPKALLPFGGRTLLERHFDILRGFGITDISVTVGYRADLIAEEVERLGLGGAVRQIENANFREGSVVSLWSARDVLASGAPILLMDADVLYDGRLIARLLDSAIANCLLLDRNIEPGDEPVKICVQDGTIVDFHKRPQAPHAWHGESVGFFRFSPRVAQELAGRVADYVGGGRRLMEYEEPIRDMILAADRGTFGFEDITGLPWTEIDFPDDVRHAREAVLPRLRDAATDAAPPGSRLAAAPVLRPRGD